MPARNVTYRKPSVWFNWVTGTIIAVLLLAGYLTSQFLPQYLLKQEAYSLLETYASQMMGRRSYYRERPEAREALHRKMTSDLQKIGIVDPNMESWIEVEWPEFRLGVIYSYWITWPFDVIPKQEHVYEIELTRNAEQRLD
jgi:hypothetical protein